MSGKAKTPFWLDGGYDRDQVEACEHHPNHRWIVVRLGDVLENPYDPDELHVICRGCFVPRCGHATYAVDSGSAAPEEPREALVRLEDVLDALRVSPPKDPTMGWLSAANWLERLFGDPETRGGK